jgi:triacylglycerol lipase
MRQSIVCAALVISALLAGCSADPSDSSPDLPTASPSPLFAKPGGTPGGDGDSSPSTGTHDPILFVHGYNSDGSTWNTMVGRFEKDGWADAELHAWTYDYTQSNATIADQLRLKVEEILANTGAAKLDIITHSMGGLSSRYYAKNLGGDAKVDAWVSLGGPNHGTTWAKGCSDLSCDEMLPGSDFLNALNADDETPGALRYATWWSPCDEVIDPKESVILQETDATNTKTACMPHRQLKEDRKVYRQVRDWVNPVS